MPIILTQKCLSLFLELERLYHSPYRHDGDYQAKLRAITRGLIAMNTIKYYRLTPGGLEIMRGIVTQHFSLSGENRFRPYVRESDDYMLKKGFTRNKPVKSQEEKFK